MYENLRRTSLHDAIEFRSFVSDSLGINCIKKNQNHAKNPARQHIDDGRRGSCGYWPVLDQGNDNVEYAAADASENLENQFRPRSDRPAASLSFLRAYAES